MVYNLSILEINLHPITVKLVKGLKVKFYNILFIILFLSSCATGQTDNLQPHKMASCIVASPQFTKEIGVAAIKSLGADLDYYYNLYSRDQFKVDNSPAEFTAHHYAQNAVLLPTVNDQNRVGIQAVHDYFDSFMTREPHLIFTQSNINQAQVTLSGCGYGVMSGYYSFNSKGKMIRARYTMQFQYQQDTETVTIDTNDGYNLPVKQNPGWYIVAHHSSIVPGQ